MSKVVLVPVATGFEEIEAISIIDVLRRANIEVIVGSLNNELLVKGANGITIQADKSVDTITSDNIDMIVLPGGWGGTKLLADDENIQNLLKDMDNKNKKIGAICAAPFALNSAGVLKDNFTCYPSVEKEIRVDGYDDTKKVVVDNNITTSRGPATAICFALNIVKQLVDEDTSLQLKEGLLADFCDI